MLVLFLLLILPARPVQAFGNCLDPGYLEAFRTGLLPQACDDDLYITIRAATGDALLRVIRLSASPGSGPIESWRPQVEALAIGVGRAMDATGAGRLPAEITVLLTDQSETTDEMEEVHADANRIAGGECRVVFYKLSSGASPEEFTFTLAHELFHCAQYNTWLDAARVDEAGWWVEGSAEYFAHLAAPDAGGQGWIDAFDSASLRTSLTAMEYEAVVFFSWIGHRGGPAAVGSFLGRMRPGDQISVLRELVPDADWINFVESWLDGEILLPGGRAIEPAPLASGNRRFAASGDLSLSAKPYSIDRWGATFIADKRFDLTHDSGSGHMAMKLFESDDPWEPPPETISTCDGEKQHILYFTATGSATDATVSVTTDEDSMGGACCLIGAWSPTQETLDGFASTALSIGAGRIAAAGGNMSCGYASGGWIITFDEAGTGALDFQSNTTSCTVRSGGGNMRFEESRSGLIGFEWEVVGAGAGRASYTENTLAWNIAIHIGPMVQIQSGADAGPSRASNGFAFACDQDRLAIQGLYGLSTAEATYLRFAE